MESTTVAEVVGVAVTQAGVRVVFGVVGSGNFHVTNAMIAAGADFVPSRHEGGAASMADAYARVSREPTAVTVHQGPGFTNALTGIVEAAKSRTPIVVLAPMTPDAMRTSNFWVDQASTAEAVGCVVVPLRSALTAGADAREAVRVAVEERRTVVLMMPTDLLDLPFQGELRTFKPPTVTPRSLVPGFGAQLAEVLSDAKRPVFIAGRGALGAREQLVRLADRTGALLATSAVVRGLFAGHPWNLDVSGGFSTPAAAELIAGADVVVGWGASLNRWTTRNGELLASTRTVVQVDDDPSAIGFHRETDLAFVADVALLAEATLAHIHEKRTAYRVQESAAKLDDRGDWREVPFEDTSTTDLIDPRAATIALDKVLPPERVVVTDGGNFNGYPAMFFGVDDALGTVLPLAFQSIGLAIASAIGAAVALPDRTVIAGVGDGGFMMSAVELDTAVREQLPLVVVVYNDHAYGAEVHHFEPQGALCDLVRFPDTDIAAIARGFGCEAVTMRSVDDLDGVEAWVAGSRTRPLVIDVKMTSFPSWVLAHTFGAAG